MTSEGNKPADAEELLPPEQEEDDQSAEEGDEMVIKPADGETTETTEDEEEAAEPKIADRLQDEHRLSFLLRQDKRFIYMAVIVIVAAIIGFGYLIRVQNIDFAALNESLVNLSQLVQDLSRHRKAEIVTTGETVVREVSEAAVYCQDSGGHLAVAKRPDGQEYSLCLFGPDKQCEEVALHRGLCPVGGIDITQYGHPADVYCIVTGNSVTPSLIPGRSGKCTVGDQTCSSDKLWQTGICVSD